MPVLATRWQRVAAGLIDGVVFVSVAMLSLASSTLAIVAFGLVAAINLWLLARHRASIGKRVLGIRMARSIVTSIPYLNLLIVIDLAFIFGKRRRCLHDYIADTIVVKA
jgi:uncharacterized RDD family membrane protein YckC